MGVFKTRYFYRWAKKSGLTDPELSKTIRELQNGLVDATLGGNLYKKRVAAPPKGKSSGYRTVLAYKANSRAIFIFGFGKRERSNVSKQELEALKQLAKVFLKMSDHELNLALVAGELKEVLYDD